MFTNHLAKALLIATTLLTLLWPLTFYLLNPTLECWVIIIFLSVLLAGLGVINLLRLRLTGLLLIIPFAIVLSIYRIPGLFDSVFAMSFQLSRLVGLGLDDCSKTSYRSETGLVYLGICGGLTRVTNQEGETIVYDSSGQIGERWELRTREWNDAMSKISYGKVIVLYREEAKPLGDHFYSVRITDEPAR